MIGKNNTSASMEQNQKVSQEKNNDKEIEVVSVVDSTPKKRGRPSKKVVEQDSKPLALSKRSKSVEIVEKDDKKPEKKEKKEENDSVKRRGRPKRTDTEQSAKKALEDLTKEIVEEEKATGRSVKLNGYAPLHPWSHKCLGFHLSTSGGYDKVPSTIIGQSFALFLRSNRNWNLREVDQKEYDNFKAELSKYERKRKSWLESTYTSSPSFVSEDWLALPHSMYLANYATPDFSHWKKSVDCLVFEMERAYKLGLHMINIHPGSTKNECSAEEGLRRVAAAINYAHRQKETGDVMVVLENTAHKGKTGSVGYSFDHLKQIIDKIHDKTRIGVCLDTCHTYCAGIDIRTQESFKERMEEFDKIIGLKYLVALHCNDSKCEYDSGNDKHDIPLQGLMEKEV